MKGNSLTCYLLSLDSTIVGNISTLLFFLDFVKHILIKQLTLLFLKGRHVSI